MKRKAVCLFLALLLWLLPFQSLALEDVAQYFEKLGDLFSRYGEYAQWTVAQKLEWIELLKVEGGQSVAQELDELDLPALPATEQEERVDRYLLSKYGDGAWLGSINLHYCLETELGPGYAWSLEEHAWVAQLYLKYFPDQWDRYIGLIPEEEDCSPEEAIAIARTAIAAAAQLPPDYDWEQFHVSVMFGVQRKYLENADPYYSIQLGTLSDDPERLPFSVMYSCYVTRTGEIMNTNDFSFTPSPEESISR